MSYEERLQAELDRLTEAVGEKEFSTLTYQMRVMSPRAVRQGLEYVTPDGQLVQDDALGDDAGDWRHNLACRLLALQQESRDAGRRDWIGATFHVRADGHFDLDFQYPSAS